jgi:hypothetical protein
MSLLFNKILTMSDLKSRQKSKCYPRKATFLPFITSTDEGSIPVQSTKVDQNIRPVEQLVHYSGMVFLNRNNEWGVSIRVTDVWICSSSREEVSNFVLPPIKCSDKKRSAGSF